MMAGMWVVKNGRWSNLGLGQVEVSCQDDGKGHQAVSLRVGDGELDLGLDAAAELADALRILAAGTGEPMGPYAWIKLKED